MSLEEVRAAVGATELDVQRHGDIDTESVYVRCQLEGWEHRAHLVDAERVDHLWTTGAVATFRVALELLESLLSSSGSAALVRRFEDSGDRIEWEWPQNIAFALSDTGDGPWHARLDVRAGRPHIDVATIDLSSARASVVAIREHARSSKIVEGARGAAVARWRADLEARCARLEQFLDIVAIATSDTPIAASGIPELVEESSWLGRHDELFTRPDDWRDALVVVASYDFARFGQVAGAGREADRTVLLVEGPFATGVSRVFRTTEEIYPLDSGLALEDVTVTVEKPVYRDDGMEKMRPDVAKATLGSATVELSGHGEELAQIARLLVAARASAGRT